PRDPEVVRAVAAYYRDTRQFDRAIATLISAPADSGDYLSELAYTYQLAGQKQKAADIYLQAANKAPGQVEIQLNAAQALVNAKQANKAEPLLKRVESADANHYRLHAIRGVIARMRHENDKAIREYERALQYVPQSVPEGVLYPIALQLDLAQLYREAGDTAK